MLTALLAWLGMLYLPFPGLWVSSGMAFLVALLVHKKVRTSRYRNEKPPRGYSFLGAFVAIFLLWTIWAMLIDAANGSVLSARIAGVIGLPASMPWLLALVGGLLAAITAGFAGLAGNWLADAVK
ncbi:MAG: hypothetical protein R3B47_16190 [Bacteroidia bacterium]